MSDTAATPLTNAGKYPKEEPISGYILRAGPSATEGWIYVMFRHLDASKGTCDLSTAPEFRSEMLATALTAVACGKAVDAHVSPGFENGAIITRLYVVA